MKLTTFAVVLFTSLFLFPNTGFSAAKVICDGVCAPDPTSPTYLSTIAARPLPANARSVFGGITPVQKHGASASTLPGSASYSYKVPIIRLPGRKGLDLNLTLYYNSRVWTIDYTHLTATFNADRDFPSYGFRLDYGYLEKDTSSTNWILTEGDGTKHTLFLSSGTVFVARDSSYITFNNSTTPTVTYKNGNQVLFQAVPTQTTLLRPIQVTDANGNYISIVYRTDTWTIGNEVSTITDTVGRVVTYNYDATSHLLQSVTVGTSTYTFGWSSLAFNYSFSSLTPTDTNVSGTVQNFLSSVAFPNGEKYTFTYGDWGIVNTIKRLSSSGTTRSSYSYNYPAASAGALSDHPTYTTQTVFDGVNTSVWTIASIYQSPGVVSSQSQTDPYGTKTTTTLFTSSWQSGLSSSVQVVDSSAHILQTRVNTWAADASTNANPRLASVTTTLNDSSQQFSIQYGYDGNGNVTTLSEYDYGLVLKRCTTTTYLSTASYVTQHILDRATQVMVYTPAAGVTSCTTGFSGTLVSRTDLAYDAVAPTSVVGAIHHDDTNHSSTFLTRGNVTGITRYANAAGASGGLTQTFTYDSLGNMIKAQWGSNQKQFTFSSTTQWVFPDSIVRGPSGTQLTTSSTYDADGNIATATDENGQITHFTYDNMDRVSTVTQPNSVQIHYTYDDAGVHPAITKTSTANSAVQVSTYDGVARPLQQQVTNGTSTISTATTQYDLMGRATQKSNYYAPSETPQYTTTQYDALGRMTSQTKPGAAGSMGYQYLGNRITITDETGKQRSTINDALGRLIEVDEPGWGDATHSTGTVTVTGGERMIWGTPCTGSAKTSCTQYWDSGSVTITVNGFAATAFYGQGTTAASMAASFATWFTNNASSPVTATAPSGSAVLTLVSRTPGSQTNYTLSVSAHGNNPGGHFPNPGFGATASGAAMTGGTTIAQSSPSLSTPIATVYSYDVIDDLVQVNQASMGTINGVAQSPQIRSFTFDSLGRLMTSVTPETGSETDFYTTAAGAACSNEPKAICRRVDARNITTTYAYDGLDRAISTSYSDGTPTVTLTYGVAGQTNTVGRLRTMTDGLGSETYTYDTLGHVISVAKVVGTSTYTLGYHYNLSNEPDSITYPSGRTVTQTYDNIGRLNQIASNASTLLTIPDADYNGTGQVLGFTYGNGVQATIGYNQRNQLSSLRYFLGTQDLLNLTYGYGTASNGQITAITDNDVASRSSSYSYDLWWRLQQAQTNDLTSANTWKLGWTYDRFGNRLSQSILGGTASVTAPQLTVSPTTNQISTAGYAYDVSGNMTNDSLHTYTFNAENHVTQVDAGAATYSYDGNGNRVKRVVGANTTVYIFAGRQVVAEYLNGALNVEYVYSPGGRLATITSAGAITYQHHDGLSTRVETNSSGTVSRTFGQFPFGEVWYETGTASKWKFTTYERDAESGLDYALARFDSSRLGRFTSPDPANGTLGDPDSLNRYTYVRNDPINLTDADGRYPQDQHEFITFFLGVMAGNPNAAAIAEGAGDADNFYNATTGLLGLGAIVNFSQHFGIPCTQPGGDACSSDPYGFGFNIHLIEDDSPNGPHQIVSGYGLGTRVLDEVLHVFMNLVGKSPDTNSGDGGFAAAWVALGGQAADYPHDAVTFIQDTVNGNHLTIVGMSITINGATQSMGDTDLSNATLIASKYVDGSLVLIWQLPSTNFYDDPNVQAIERSFSLPGSDPMAEAEALYEYQVSQAFGDNSNSGGSSIDDGSGGGDDFGGGGGGGGGGDGDKEDDPEDDE